MKYKPGDKVRIVSEKTEEMGWNSEMNKYLGKTMTVEKVFRNYYNMVEDEGQWFWDDDMIEGFASEEQETPLGYQEAIRTYKKICNSTTECIDCPLDSDNNGTQTTCNYFIRDYTEKAEPILKKWLAEHPVKTNEQKCNEMFLETFGVPYATALMDINWWQEEYIEPKEEKE